MTAFAGVRGTGDWGTDERPKNFREGILRLNPNGTAPIFALMGKMSKKVVDDPEYSWWAEPNDVVRLQVNGALNNAATTVVVDSDDPDSTNLAARWGSPLNLVPGDLLMVEPAADTAVFSPEIVRVVTANAASIAAPTTTFTIARGQAGTTAAAIANDGYLLKIGSAFSEGTRSPDAASRNPIKYKNFTQIFKNTYEVTGTAKETRARTGDPVKNDKMRKAFDHSRDIEMAILFGQSHEDTAGANGQPRRFMGGLREFLPNKVLASNWTMNNLLDMISPVFDWDSSAGDSRMVFCGNGALNSLNKKIEGSAGARTRFMFQGTKNMYGVKFNHYRVPQGDFLLEDPSVA